MQRYFDQIEALNDIGQVLAFSRDALAQQGVQRASYHVAPLFDEPSSQNFAVYGWGFGDAWLNFYAAEDMRAADPICQRTMQHGAMLTWAEARDAAPNSPANEAFFDALEKHGLMHGVGVPLFGPNSRDAYAGFDFGKPIIEVDPEAVGTVRSITQACHQRICVLLNQAANVPVLSEREIEVLTWTARGKSASDIATILELSPDTVKTYSKRIYAKLDVSDRVAAVVKALRMGLVRV